MIRTIAVAVALLAATPAFAIDLIGTHSELPSTENGGTTEAAKPKPKPAKAETSDYLVVTLYEAAISH